MKAINNLRAKLIHSQYGSGNCSIVITDVLKSFLKNCPSCSEVGECVRKGCTSKKHEHIIPVLGVDSNTFNNNMGNLQLAMITNFPNQNNCKKCGDPFTKFQRTLGPHLFVEVSECNKTKT